MDIKRGEVPPKETNADNPILEYVDDYIIYLD